MTVTVKEGKVVYVTCDCGCRKKFQKQPNKIKAHHHHFKNPHHYHHWMRRQKKRNVGQHHLHRLKFYGELLKREREQRRAGCLAGRD